MDTIDQKQGATEKEPVHVVVRQAQVGDAETVLAIAREWVKSPSGETIEDEITEIKEALERSVGENPDRSYIVAELGGEVVGVMGLTVPNELMRQHAQTDNPVEIVNAFVRRDLRGAGVGGKLLDNVFEQARIGSFDEVIVNSGPRYKDTAWSFYDKKFGTPRAILKDYYGAGRDAPFWSKVLAGADAAN